MVKSTVDIYILTGFLGSGKSTLLAHLLRHELAQGRRIGVIMNELGEVSIDSSFVPEECPIRELLNGCICCSIQGELATQLHDMLHEQELDGVYIEATGVAHPMEIVDAVTNLAFAPLVNLRYIATTVDSRQWLERDRLKRPVRKLLEAQVTYADVILLNKADRVSEEQQQDVINSVEQLNAKARLFITTQAQIDPAELAGEGQKGSEAGSPNETTTGSTNGNTAGNEPRTEPRTTPSYTSSQTHTTAHVHDHLHLRSVTIPLNKPVDRDALESWLQTTPFTIHRAKGFLTLTGPASNLEAPSQLYLFQYSYGQASFTPYQTEKAYQPVLVLIGEDLHASNIQEELASTIFTDR
ncbi:CobW family GTP-binding protein [Brevibacillus dissolubilis]|uniref:CobW family GTP-binding protein n=1 Tax=Brevibacillus dissolubilis TaxID=1844116 RepID=UPI001116310A|nr:GTP-binding protein [Brevibacillus dissolubilis]